MREKLLHILSEILYHTLHGCKGQHLIWTDAVQMPEAQHDYRQSVLNVANF